jgi:acetolactate synthase I/II/III large subunit
MMCTGGAIGIGIPLSVGAAIACPDRKVVTLQADGSGMYTLQGLWTAARERLDMVVIVFANHAYAILRAEMQNVGVNQFGHNAGRMLRLDDPDLDWVHLAKGMGVEAARADTCEGFADLYRSALGRKGPFLIEAVI